MRRERQERLVVVEGGSGVGKTTAVNGLKRELSGWKFLREPGGTEFGDLVRAAVQEGDGYPVDPVAAFLAFSASRANLVEYEIRPWLAQDGRVLLDRYYYSSLAYQGGGEGVDRDFILAVSLVATKGMEPGLVLYYDLVPELAAVRKSGKENLDRYDIKELEFHRRVREVYMELAECDPDTWQVIDAGQRPEEVLAQSLAALRERGLI